MLPNVTPERLDDDLSHGFSSVGGDALHGFPEVVWHPNAPDGGTVPDRHAGHGRTACISTKREQENCLGRRLRREGKDTVGKAAEVQAQVIGDLTLATIERTALLSGCDPLRLALALVECARQELVGRQLQTGGELSDRA